MNMSKHCRRLDDQYDPIRGLLCSYRTIGDDIGRVICDDAAARGSGVAHTSLILSMHYLIKVSEKYIIHSTHLIIGLCLRSMCKNTMLQNMNEADFLPKSNSVRMRANFSF